MQAKRTKLTKEGKNTAFTKKGIGLVKILLRIRLKVM